LLDGDFCVLLLGVAGIRIFDQTHPFPGVLLPLQDRLVVQELCALKIILKVIELCTLPRIELNRIMFSEKIMKNVI
jgi:hypothetical protein